MSLSTCNWNTSSAVFILEPLFLICGLRLTYFCRITETSGPKRLFSGIFTPLKQLGRLCLTLDYLPSRGGSFEALETLESKEVLRIFD